MNIICTICHDTLTCSDDVLAIYCGHMFHSNCLTTWLRRSRTCPQCREKVTTQKIHKLYFTNGIEQNNSNITNLPLQEQVNNMKFQILLKQKDIRSFISKNNTLDKQNAGLRREIRKMESDINQQKSLVYSLKKEIAHLKQTWNSTSKEHEVLKRKYSATEKKLQEYKKYTLAAKKHDQIRERNIIQTNQPNATTQTQRATNIQQTQELIHNKDENLCSRVKMTEAHEFINEPEHRHLEKSDSKERSIVKSSNTSRKGQTDRKKKSGNENNSTGTNIETVTFPSMIQEEGNTLHAALINKCPTLKKKAKIL